MSGKSGLSAADIRAKKRDLARLEVELAEYEAALKVLGIFSGHRLELWLKMRKCRANIKRLERDIVRTER